MSAAQPATARRHVREVLHGIELDDPYRWLERDDPEALAWDESENERTREYIRALPGFGELRARMFANPTPWLSPVQASVVGPLPCGDRWVWLEVRSKAYPRLHSGDEPLGEGEVILDPDRMPPGMQRLTGYMPSPDGRWCAVRLSRAYEIDRADPARAGAVRDQSTAPKTLAVLDVERRELLPVRLTTAGMAGDEGWLAWLPDSSGFIYRGLGDAGSPERAILSHRLGDESAALEFAAVGGGVVQVSPDGRYALVVTGDMFAGQAFLKELPSGRWRLWMESTGRRFQGWICDERVIARTTEGAPRGRIVSIPIDAAEERSAWTELVPEDEMVAQFVAIAGDRLIAGYQDDQGQTLRVYTLDGRPDGTVPLEGGGVPASWSGRTAAVVPCPGGVSFYYQGAAQHPAHYRFRLADRTLQRVALTGDPGPLRQVRLEARARDGVGIPVHLVLRPDTDLARPRPVVLLAYGNLGATFAFDPVTAFLPFLDAGGVYAWASVRGGGERGLEWWDHGRGADKGRPSSDVVAVAEHLIAEGVTERRRIGFTYNSGGGMLAAIALARRPDLFGAVVAVGALTDFLRHHHFFELHEEWPTPSDAALVRANLEWSAYQNVRDGEAYPASLFISYAPEVGWTGQCRKLVAALRHASSSDAPLLYRCMHGFAHWDSGPASGENGPDAGEADVERLAFLMSNLGMDPREGARS